MLPTGEYDVNVCVYLQVEKKNLISYLLFMEHQVHTLCSAHTDTHT